MSVTDVPLLGSEALSMETERPLPPTVAEAGATLPTATTKTTRGSKTTATTGAPTAPTVTAPSATITTDPEASTVPKKPNYTDGNPPEWAAPLDDESNETLFGSAVFPSAAPIVRLDPDDTSRALYQFETLTVPESIRDELIKSMSTTKTIPTTLRKIEKFSIRIQLNNELARLSGSDKAILGVTTSASMSTMLGNNYKVDPANYLRYAYAAYSGTMFGIAAATPYVDAEELAAQEAAELETAKRIAENLAKFGSPLTRPNGSVYYPRKVRASDLTVFDTQIIHDAYEARIPVLLYGEPGTGKTALCEAVLPNLVTISGTADTETADFLGSYIQNPDGSFEWVDGPLIQAMEAGAPLFIDEIALIDSRVLALVYSVMDGRDEIVVTANPKRGVIKAKPGFYVIGACNPNVPGAVMSDALMSRFSLQLEVTTDYDMLTTLGIPADIISAAKNFAKMAATGEINKAPETRELLAYTKVAATFGREMALANLVAGAQPNDRDTYAKTLSSAFAIDVKALRV